MTKWAFLFCSLLFSMVSVTFFFFLINTHQSCSKTPVIIKYLIFTARFALDLCELSLNFFILTKPLPQNLCILISQDKNLCIIHE